MTYALTHAAMMVVALVAFATGLSLFRSRRTPQSILAWLLGLVFVPFVTIPLFVLFGARKFPARAKRPAQEPGVEHAWPDDSALPAIARVLRASGVAPPRAAQRFELLRTGEAAYARLLALIRDAEHSIDLTVFILAWDETGREIVDALAERAARGVRVRVILDAVGSAHSRGKATAALRAVGAELRVFMPFSHSPLRGRHNLRNHRKVAVFDARHVFAGGMNLADEYMGRPGLRREPRWRDVAAVVNGSLAADATALFESDWRFCGDEPRRERILDPADASAAAAGSATVQLVPSGPDFVTDTIYDLFLSAIFAAKERLLLVTPYYVPDDVLGHALVLCARRGVRTEVIVPSVSNHYLADVARRGGLRDLALAGATIKYFVGGMVHAKAMVVDDVFAYVGSPNFDMRSMFLNYESALCLYSPEAIGSVRAYLDELAAECTVVGPPTRERRFWEQLAVLLSPEL